MSLVLKMESDTLYEGIELMLMRFGYELKEILGVEHAYYAFCPGPDSGQDSFVVLLTLETKRVLVAQNPVARGVDEGAITENIDVYDPKSSNDLLAFVRQLRSFTNMNCDKCDGCGKMNARTGKPWNSYVGNDEESIRIEVDGEFHYAETCGDCMGLGRRRAKDPNEPSA